MLLLLLLLQDGGDEVDLDKEAEVEATRKKPKRQRFERYDDDFIDDSEIEKVKGGPKVKTQFSGFYINKVQPPSWIHAAGYALLSGCFATTKTPSLHVAITVQQHYCYCHSIGQQSLLRDPNGTWHLTEHLLDDCNLTVCAVKRTGLCGPLCFAVLVDSSGEPAGCD